MKPKSVFVIAPFYAYEGYGEPEAVFATRKLAETELERIRKMYHTERELFELPLITARAKRPRGEG